MFASAALVGQQAIGDLMALRPVTQGGWAIGVMVISIALTGLLVAAAQSQVLKSAASVAVSGGMAATALRGRSRLQRHRACRYRRRHLGQFARADAIAALGIAALLLWGAVGVFPRVLEQLMDHELPDHDQAQIDVDLLTEDQRLTDVHQLPPRAAGPYVHIQTHVDLDPELTLEAAHGELPQVAAEKRVLEASADIIIHADPRGRAEPHGGAFAEAQASEA